MFKNNTLNFARNNQYGTTHLIVPLLILIVVAVAGTFFMVSSKAYVPKVSKITSAKLTTKSSVKGFTNKAGEYCGYFVVKYKVRTAGTMQSVSVQTFTQASDTGVDAYALKQTGKNLWTGTQDKQVCSNKKGRTKLMPTFTYLAAVAKNAETQDVRAFPSKSVALR